LRRRDLLRRAGIASVGFGAFAGLFGSVAAPVSAADATVFTFAGVDSAGNVDGVEHFITASGSGVITGGSVEGQGAFTHYDNAVPGNPKPVLGAGTWTAKRLVSFKETGSYGAMVAGVADIEVELVQEAPSPARAHAVLRVVSNLPQAGIATGEPSGYFLVVPGGPVGPYRPVGASPGMAVFTRTNAAAVAAAIPEAITQADTPEKALVLEPDRTLKGHLPAGGRRGSFAYYKFEYAGDESAYNVNLHVTPERPEELLTRVGFNVYGREPGKVYAQGAPQPGMNPNVTGDLVSSFDGWYVVQVYNYDPTTAVDFEISGVANDPPPEGE
jgi:hypothetical protein